MSEKNDMKPWVELASRRTAMSWAVACLLAVGIVGIAFVLLQKDYQAVNQEGQQRADSLAKIAATQMASTLSALDVGLQTVEVAPIGAGGTERGKVAALERLAAAIPAISNLRFVDARAAAQTMDASDRAVLAYHRDDSRAGIRFSHLEQDGQTMQFSQRLDDRDGALAGIIIGNLDAGQFAGFLAEIGADKAVLRLSPDASLEVYARDGKSAGRDQFVAAATLNGYPLAVEIGLDRANLLGPWESKRNVGVALVFVLLLLILGAVVAYRQHATQALTLAGLEAMTKMEAAARRRADEISRRKSDFISNMSHELRTPLNAIIGFSEVIKGEAFGPVGLPKYREYADDIHYSAQHLLGVINNILDLSKVEAGKWQISEDDVDLIELFDSLTRLAAERASRENVQLAIGAAPEDIVIRGDKRTLLQIMLNLTINAIKFAGPDRCVDLGVSRLVDGSLAIDVADHGNGMTKEEQLLAMRPFDAPNTDKRKQDTGLGLPLAAAFAELHGGRVELQSAPGSGTTARLILPATRVQGSC